MFQDIYSQVWAMESTALRVFAKNMQDKGFWDKLFAVIPSSFSKIVPCCETRQINASELDIQAANDSQAKGRKNGKNYNIRVIPVEGTLTRKSNWSDDYFGIMSTEKIGALLDEANGTDEIDAILLVFNTNGGVVEGTEQLAKKIKNSSKPVIAFINSKAHSAGYWLASQCSKILMNEYTSMCGSIGTMCLHINQKGYYEQNGIEINYINSDGSEDKNSPNDVQALDEKGLAMMKDVLNPLNEIFLNAIKANRPNIDASAMTGKIYSATEAIKLGMVDGVASLGDALLQTAKLVQNNEKATNMEKGTQGEGVSFQWFQTKLDAQEQTILDLQASLKTANENIAKLEGEKLALKADADKLPVLQVELDAAKKGLNEKPDAEKTSVETEADLVLSGTKNKLVSEYERKLKAEMANKNANTFTKILQNSKKV